MKLLWHFANALSTINCPSRLSEPKYRGNLPAGAAGFSPRKQNLTLYLMAYSFDRQADLLSRLGKHSLGKGCLYIKRLADVDTAVLNELVKRSVTGQPGSA